MTLAQARRGDAARLAGIGLQIIRVPGGMLIDGKPPIATRSASRLACAPPGCAMRVPPRKTSITAPGADGRLARFWAGRSGGMGILRHSAEWTGSRRASITDQPSTRPFRVTASALAHPQTTSHGHCGAASWARLRAVCTVETRSAKPSGHRSRTAMALIGWLISRIPKKGAK